MTVKTEDSNHFTRSTLVTHLIAGFMVCALSACGKRSGLAEQLPNREVPLNTSVLEYLPTQESSNEASPSSPTPAKKNSIVRDTLGTVKPTQSRSGGSSNTGSSNTTETQNVVSTTPDVGPKTVEPPPAPTTEKTTNEAVPSVIPNKDITIIPSKKENAPTSSTPTLKPKYEAKPAANVNGVRTATRRTDVNPSVNNGGANSNNSASSNTSAANSPLTTNHTSELILSATAARLAQLSSAEYKRVQKRWIGDTSPECNYFLITALCEAGYCKTKKPFFRAADFDTYFIDTGWKQITLAELREKAARNEAMDVVFQKDNPNPKLSGHVMVYIAYTPDAKDGDIMIAQGDQGRATHEMFKQYERNILEWEGGYNIFIRQ